MKFLQFIMQVLIFWPIGYVLERLLHEYLIGGTPGYVIWTTGVIISLLEHFFLLDESKKIKMSSVEMVIFIFALTLPGIGTGLLVRKLFIIPSFL